MKDRNFYTKEYERLDSCIDFAKEYFGEMCENMDADYINALKASIESGWPADYVRDFINEQKN